MARQKSGPAEESITTPIEHELTMRLERAHLLAERAQRANGHAREEINRAREIADALCDEFHHARHTRR
jgi:hypothetical protein